MVAPTNRVRSRAGFGRNSALSSGGGRVQPSFRERSSGFPRICAEVWVLFAICMLDLISSAWLFHHGLATELNPVLRGAAAQGTVPFVLVKLASFLPGLCAAEWHRRRRPRFVRSLLRGVISAYLVIYCAGVAGQFLR